MKSQFCTKRTYVDPREKFIPTRVEVKVLNIGLLLGDCNYFLHFTNVLQDRFW